MGPWKRAGGGGGGDGKKTERSRTRESRSLTSSHSKAAWKTGEARRGTASGYLKPVGTDARKTPGWTFHPTGRPTGYLIPLGPATWGITLMEKSFPGTGLTTQTARKEIAPPLQSQVCRRAGDLDGEAAAELLSWHQDEK